MSRTKVVLMTGWACLLFAGAVQGQVNNQTVLPTQRLLAPYGLERAWWNQATIDPARDRVRYLVADEDVLVVQTRSGMVTAFDAENGKRLWARQLGRRDAVSFPAVMNQDLALILSGSNLYAIRKFTGGLHWTLRVPVAPSTSPGIDEDLVYIGARDGSVFAFDLRKVLKFYKEGLLPQWSYQAMAWRYKGFKEVVTPPLSTGRVVNFATRGGSLYSVTTKFRKLVFQFETDAPVSAPLAMSQRSLFLPSEDFKLYCLNAENGETLWVYNAGLPIRKKPEVVEEEVYVTPSSGGIHCVDALTGKRKWWRPKVTDFVAASRESVFASDTISNLLILRREDGALLGALPLRSFSVHFANDRTDRIFLARPNGLVTCLREKGSEFPVYHRHPERQPILPEFAPDSPPQSGN